MIGKGWTLRVPEAGLFPVRATWDEVWPLMARAQVETFANLRGWLWRHRYASWLASLSADDASCRYCGAVKPTDRKGRLFCSDACKTNAHQASSRGSEWPLSRATRYAHEELLGLGVERAEAEAWLLSFEGRRAVLPPDLAALDNLPPLPDRCEAGCVSKPCRWTRGGPCLFANTAQET